MDCFPELFVIGFDGPELPADVAEKLRRGLAGVALFKRNILDRNQLAELCRSIRLAAQPSGLTPIIAVDQEGGRVQRLRDVGPRFPSMREVDDPLGAGEAIGRELALLGFNLDFAPVLDVDSNPRNPIIGDRSFSADPDVAAARATAFYKGLGSAGIAGCGKHFPGHGDASADSHLELPVIDVGPDVLAMRELKPFAAAVEAGFGMFMTAHCLFPSIDPDLPATLSPSFIRPLLRDRLHFDGVVITDDLGMKAISDRFPPRRIIELGVAAGVDLFLHCGTDGESEALMSSMEALVESGAIPVQGLEASIARVRRFRAGLC